MKLYTLLICCFLSASTFAAVTVKVGIYDFPPYAFITDKTTGITVQMLAAMNKFQQEYKFVAVPTTAKRRYFDFENNKFDMLIFESKNWGWQKYPMLASQIFVTGAEVYVTQAKANRTQDYFSSFQNKTMIGVLGYHYQFANFNSDLNYLEKEFNVLLTYSQKKSLELILNNRGDIAILSKEYLNYYFSIFPEDEAKLMISDKFDQVYIHTILIREKHLLSVQYINNLLEQMRLNGVLTPLWAKYGLKSNQKG